MATSFDFSPALRAVCKDILATGVTIPNEGFYWSKRASKLPDAKDTAHYTALLVRGLVGQGILKKICVGQTFAFAKKLPDAFFKGNFGRGPTKVCWVYRVENRDQIKCMAAGKIPVGNWLGLPTRSVSVFKEALEIVRKEIASHPDPARFFLGVLQKLYPRP